MKNALAEKLLIKVMGWTMEEVAKERPLIQALAKLKYDEYQQFSPGIRFTESLAQWLGRFEPPERKTAYEFIKSKLIFISNEQVSHLVSICFAVKINPCLLTKAAGAKNIPTYRVSELHSSVEYIEIKRRSLFLGVSDGAKIDQLRRSSGLNNEQVFSSYYISEEKRDDMLKELNAEGYEGKFNSVYLIDDFTGSGLSYAREEKGKITGKIIKFLKLVYNIEVNGASVLSEMIEIDGLDIHMIFYISRRASIDHLKDFITKWRETHNLTFNFTVEAIQLIEDNFKEEVIKNTQLIDLSKKYITSKIIDRHYEKGKTDEYYLGFDECSLPLVLHHNTPNNSLPILWWYPEDDSFKGLFPRVTRHRE